MINRNIEEWVAEELRLLRIIEAQEQRLINAARCEAVLRTQLKQAAAEIERLQALYDARGKAIESLHKHIVETER
jgi:hypothetical protein